MPRSSTPRLHRAQGRAPRSPSRTRRASRTVRKHIAQASGPSREEVVATLPDLEVDYGNFPSTAYSVRDLLAASGCFFGRGTPVLIATPADKTMPIAMPLTRHHVVLATHRLARPVRVDGNWKATPVTLPNRVAELYLAMTGEWHLLPLVGITSTPLLSDDGGARVAEGYDAATGLWCAQMPAPCLPERPSRAEAEAALLLLRRAFRTFAFGDAARMFDPSLGVEVVDHRRPMGMDESGFVHGLLTAVCRPSLWLAPGLAIAAPALSGSGVGKGLLARAVSIIAFGSPPRAFTMGNDRAELDKRLVAALIEARPFVFLDNVNGVALRSDALASAMTERPAHVRVLGVSRMVPLNSAAFICVTGNGLTVTEDLARRFLWSELDARMEDPEQRPFAAGFLKQIESRRAEFLAAVLTIWRWGRQNAAELRRGRPLGGFEHWAEWCRDSLLTLGCPDPVEHLATLKSRDTRRQRVAEIFELWWAHHGPTPMKVTDLAGALKTAIDPQNRSRQYLARAVQQLAGTRAAGFVLTRQEPAGQWGAATYRLEQTQPTERERPMPGDGARHAQTVPTGAAGDVPASDGIGHRVHRGHRSCDTSSTLPITPMSPMPYEVQGKKAREGVSEAAYVPPDPGVSGNGAAAPAPVRAPPSPNVAPSSEPLDPLDIPLRRAPP